MSDNIIQLVNAEVKINKDIVDLLEVVLDLAKKGDVQAVAIATVGKDSNGYHVWNGPKLTGALNNALHSAVCLLFCEFNVWLLEHFKEGHGVRGFDATANPVTAPNASDKLDD